MPLAGEQLQWFQQDILSMLFRISRKLWCCPICLIISDTESVVIISIYISHWNNWHELKPTPIRVNMISCEITKNAKYRATTARSKRDCVKAPWYLEIQRIMMGRTKPKSADTAGGSTPETTSKEEREDWDQFSRNGTKMAIFGHAIRRNSVRKKHNTHGGQVGENGKHEERDSVQEGDDDE